MLQRWLPRETRNGGQQAVPPAQVVPLDDAPLPVITGVDIAQGLKRVDNNRQLYVDMLRKFATGYSDTEIQLRTALRDRRHDDAVFLVHSIKGLSGTLGALVLYASAMKLEEALRHGAKGIKDRVTDFLSDLHAVQQAIITALDSRHTPPRKSAIPLTDTATLQSLLERMRELDNETAAQNVQGYAGRAFAIQSPGDYLHRLAILETQLTRYRFDDALDTLNAITNVLGQ